MERQMDRRKVFLGGTCGKYHWRDDFIERVTRAGVSPERLFNPVLPPGVPWTDAAKEEEDKEKEVAQYLLFHLANPLEPKRPAHSEYSLIQVVQSVFNVRRTTKVFFDDAHLDARTAKSIKAIITDVEEKFPGTVCANWASFADEITKLWQSRPGLRAFLAGTCGNNHWRERLLAQLASRGIDTKMFFDPMVPAGTWNAGVQKLEDQARILCDCEFFYIGDPLEARTIEEQVSPYSLAEALFGLYSDPERVIVSFDFESWNGFALESMQKFFNDVRRDFPTAKVFGSLTEVEDWMIKNLIS